MKVMRDSRATMREGSHATKASDVIMRQRDGVCAAYVQGLCSLSFLIDKLHVIDCVAGSYVDVE